MAVDDVDMHSENDALLVNELDGSGWTANVVPRRLEMLNLSWVFLWASATLTVEFVLIEQGYLTGNPSLVNAVGLVSCSAWFYGFLMLDAWLVSLARGTVSHIPKVALAGALIKTVAAFLFNVQPLTALVNKNAGADWSNLAGICLFHTGNCISLFDMMVLDRNKVSGFLYKTPLAFSNLPVYGMMAYTSATVFLVSANAWEYNKDAGKPTNEFSILGGSLLCLGSVLFVTWAGIVPRLGVRPKAMPDSILDIELSY